MNEKSNGKKEWRSKGVRGRKKRERDRGGKGGE
jgi:hypothetical protein